MELCVWLSGRKELGERDDSPSKARRPLAAAATSTATPAAHDVQDPGASAAGAQEGGFPDPPFVSGMWKHGGGDVEAVTSAWNCHRHCVAQNRAAKVHPVSEGLREGVELGPSRCRHLGGCGPLRLVEGVFRAMALGKERLGVPLRVGARVRVGSWDGQFSLLGHGSLWQGWSVGVGRASSSYWVL